MVINKSLFIYMYHHYIYANIYKVDNNKGSDT